MVKKKSFSGDLTGAMNPVLQIIDTTKTAEEAPRADAPKAEAPEGYYMDPRFIEKKTRRVGLLMRPSLYARLKEYADDIEESLNEAVDILLEGILPPEKIPEKRSDNDEGRERR